MKKILHILLLVVIIIAFLSNTVLADDITASMQGVGSSSDNAKIVKVGGNILGVVIAIGQGIALVMLVVIGIKFMIASPSEKAEVKKEIIPYVIGAVLIFASTAFLSIAQGLGQSISNAGIGM